MLTILFRDKNLTATLSSPIYQYDNNIDQIKCIIPCMYDNRCLKDATVTMIYKDESGNGGFIELAISDDLFTKDYHQFYNRINSKITSTSGKITTWLKISNINEDYSFETGETSFMILPSKEIPKSNSNPQLSYFDQQLIKMTQIQNSTLKIQRDTINLANSTRAEIDKLRQEIAIMKGGGI